MAVLIAHAEGGSSDANVITTSSVDTTGATLLVAVASFGGTGMVVTDSKSNTWTALTVHTASSSSVQIFYAANPTVGSGHTFTATLSGQSPAIAVMAFDGALTTSPFDVENGAASTSASSLATGSITPTVDNTIIVAGLHTVISGVGPVMCGTPFAVAGQIPLSAGHHFGVAGAYMLQETAAAVNPTFTWTGGSTSCTAAIASFKTTATSGGSGGSGGAWAFCG